MEILAFWGLLTAIITVLGFSYLVYLGLGDELILESEEPHVIPHS
jgi:hypothetical protein